MYTGQEILATNPCSEQPLPPNGVCNLGSHDLSKYLTSDRQSIDWDKLEIATRLGVRFLDAVIDVTTFPTEEIKQWAIDNPVSFKQKIKRYSNKESTKNKRKQHYSDNKELIGI
jgi:hypothetical protein